MTPTYWLDPETDDGGVTTVAGCILCGWTQVYLDRSDARFGARHHNWRAHSMPGRKMEPIRATKKRRPKQGLTPRLSDRSCLECANLATLRSDYCVAHQREHSRARQRGYMQRRAGRAA